MSLERGTIAALGALLFCSAACSPVTGATGDRVPTWSVLDAPPLPVPLANNAVAAARVAGHDLVFSFLGLGAGRDYQAIARSAYELDVERGTWERLPEVPGRAGRLASTAQALGDRVYVFGGYEVAADGKETTSPAVDIYDIREQRYTRGADPAAPVDDSVSGVWRERLVVLVGGWSTSHSVPAVQFYDPARDAWLSATPMIGTPVFGHSGAIVRDVIVYCDGAQEQAPLSPKYALTSGCYRGDIDPVEPTRIAWRRIASHPGPPRYRMAAGPIETGEIVGVLFAGGTTNPYNYNGVGYDGRPSEPESTSWVYDIERDRWIDGPTLIAPTMDHRGLVRAGKVWFIVGGFGRAQQVTSHVTRLVPPRAP